MLSVVNVFEPAIVNAPAPACVTVANVRPPPSKVVAVAEDTLIVDDNEFSVTVPVPSENTVAKALAFDKLTVVSVTLSVLAPALPDVI